MFIKHHTRGIVISGQAENGENKRINIFTEKFGLVFAKAQGVRKISSKMRSNVQDFACGEFSLVHGKSGWRIVGAKTEKNFYEKFKNSPEKLKIVNNILNLIKKLVTEEEGRELFSIIINFLSYLERAKEGRVALAECLVLLKILKNLGYMRHDPELSVPISSEEMTEKDLEIIAPRRTKIIRLINESLRAI